MIKINDNMIILLFCRPRKVMRKWKSWHRWHGNKLQMPKTSKCTLNVCINSHFNLFNSKYIALHYTYNYVSLVNTLEGIWQFYFWCGHTCSSSVPLLWKVHYRLNCAFNCNHTFVRSHWAGKLQSNSQTFSKWLPKMLRNMVA